jgi:hypothetical protein
LQSFFLFQILTTNKGTWQEAIFDCQGKSHRSWKDLMELGTVTSLAEATRNT